MKPLLQRTSLLLVGLLVSLIAITPSALAATGTTSSSALTPTYTSKFSGSGSSQIDEPYGIGRASNGSVFVSDSDDYIKVFSSNGTYITEFGGAGSGNGQLSQPLGVAVAANGNVYVADSNNDRVEVFSASGEYVSQFSTSGSGYGQLSYPIGIAIAADGTVYVSKTSDYGSGDSTNRIERFTSQGVFVSEFASSGSGNGQLSYPDGIAVGANGNVYVSNTGNKRIEVYASDGTYITHFDGGPGDNKLTSPEAIAVDIRGNVYVGDQNFNDNTGRIEVFTSNGAYVIQFKNSGLAYPEGIATSTSDTVYVSNYGVGEIETFVYPQNQGSVTSSVGSSQINVVLPTSANISSLTSSESNQSDEGYSYPVGLVNFTATVVSGSTTEVQVTFQINLSPNQVTARKYDSATKKYTAIPGAIISQTTIDNMPALQVTYSVTDGGILDEDGIANGILVDPIGLATMTGSPDTSYGVPTQSDPIVTFLVTSSIVSTTIGLFVLYRRHKRSA